MESNLIQKYLEIERESEKMLMAAQIKDWNSLCEYEKVCAVLIEHLRSLQKENELQKSEKRQKSLIMQRILSNDAKIRSLCEPWLESLEEIVSGRVVLH